MSQPKTALVHYWLSRIRGGEAVLAALMREYPQAPVYTNVYDAAATGILFEGRAPPITTWINKLPGAVRAYPLYMPLMPSALEQIDLNEFDLIISSESGPAKWVIPAPSALHVCYVHTPMRYLWDQRHIYRSRLKWPATAIFDRVTCDLRVKDFVSASRVDHFVANSEFVASRIRQFYRREATVINPPVQLHDLPAPREPEDFYLLAGQLVSYKQSMTAVNACIKAQRRLIVVGDGPDAGRIQALKSKWVDFRGRVSRAELVMLMANARALLFPGTEDFGITPVEVLGAGRPVVGYAKGGVLESVKDFQTGILYKEPSVDGLVKAIYELEEWLPNFKAADAVVSASRFSESQFQANWRDFIAQVSV